MDGSAPQVKLRTIKRFILDVRKLRPGMGAWYEDASHNASSLVVACPGGCRHFIITALFPSNNRFVHLVTWNLDRVKPTFDEPLWCRCGWRGRLLAGTFVQTE